MGLIFTYPGCVGNVSNQSRTERVTLRLAQCVDSGGWNHTPLCLECYCQPYLEDDVFTFQIGLPYDQLFVSMKIYDLDGNYLNAIIPDHTTYWDIYGVQSNVKLDMGIVLAAAGTPCFRVELNYSDNSYMSEAFCPVLCDQETVLIYSDYDNIDCNGRVFDFSDAYSSFPLPAIATRNAIRLVATLEYSGVNIENTYNEIDTSISSRIVQTKSKNINVYQLRVWGIPAWQVKHLSAILSGKNLVVQEGNNSSDAQIYQVKGGFDKGVKTGNLWFPIIQLEQQCNIFNKAC